MSNSHFLKNSNSDESTLNHLRFTDSAEDELQTFFVHANSLIEQRLRASLPEVQSDDQVASNSRRLRLLQEMLIEQLPSIRSQNLGAK